MNCVRNRAGLIVGLMLAGGAFTGCAEQKKQFDRFPKPIFSTKPPRKARPRPIPPPVQHYAYIPPRAPAPRPVIRPTVVAAEPGWTPPRGIRNRWQEIVIHHSASSTGGAVAFDKYHRNEKKWDELGYHFVIGNGSDTGDGRVEVGSRWTKQKTGAHCKTGDNYYNEHGIGICLVGNFENSSPSRAQLVSLDKLILFLSKSCGMTANNIRGHGAVTHKTVCPGRRLPLSTIKRNLTLAQSQMQSNMLVTADSLH